MTSQGDGKSVKEYVKSIPMVKEDKPQEDAADEFLAAFNSGFKGID